MYDIITIGSATVDLFAQSNSQIIKIFKGRKETDLLAFEAGSKILLEKIEYSIGGGATNAAAVAKKLGLKVATIAKIGDDHNSKLIEEDLKKRSIDTKLLIKGKGPSSFSIVLDYHHEDRAILAHKGITNKIKITELKLKKAKYIYASSLIGASFKALIYTAKWAEKNNISFAFNPSSYLAKKGISYLKPILERTSILIFNKEESEMLTKQEDKKKILKTLHNLGIKIVVITDGKRGAIASDNQKTYQIKGKTKHIVDTTGAGDCFAATFVCSIIKGKNIKTALKFAGKNASSTITKIGAKNGNLTWKQLNSIN